MSAPYQAFRGAHGFITIGGANGRSFGRICIVLGHPEWADAPEFKTDGVRIRHRSDLAARIESITATQPHSHWLALFDASNIPCGPISKTVPLAQPSLLVLNMLFA